VGNDLREVSHATAIGDRDVVGAAATIGAGGCVGTAKNREARRTRRRARWSREVKGLTAEDFPERQAAIKRLEALVAEQIKQRAAVQEIGGRHSKRPGQAAAGPGDGER